MQILNIFHVLIAIAMVAFVLVQRGPGATAGAAFGSGASGTVFGARGAGSFLSRATWVMATLFCLISLTMAVIVSRAVVTPETDLGVVGGQQQPQVEQPAEPTDGDLPDLTDADQGSDLPELDTAGSGDADPDLSAPAEDAEPEAPAEQGSPEGDG